MDTYKQLQPILQGLAKPTFLSLPMVHVRIQWSMAQYHRGLLILGIRGFRITDFTFHHPVTTRLAHL